MIFNLLRQFILSSKSLFLFYLFCNKSKDIHARLCSKTVFKATVKKRGKDRGAAEFAKQSSGIWGKAVVSPLPLSS